MCSWLSSRSWSASAGPEQGPIRPGDWSGGGDPQDARCGGWEPPVPAAEDPDEGGHQQGSDDYGVEEDSGAQGGGEHLDGGLGGGWRGEEDEEEDQRGAGDQSPGPDDAGHDGVVRRAGGVVFLADAGQDEHLVVHRQPEQEGEGQQGHVHGDRPGGGDGPQGVAAVALLPHQHHDPVGHAERGQVEDDRLDGQYQGPERPGQQDQGDQGDQGEHQREAAVHGAGEAGVARALAADADDPWLAGDGLLDGGEGGRPGGGARLGDGQDLDQPGAARRRVRGGVEGGIDPGDVAGLAGYGAGPSGGGQHVDGADDPPGDSAAFQAGEGRLRRAARGQGLAGRLTQAQAEQRDGQCRHHEQPAGEGGGPVPQHEAGPPCPGAAGVGLPAQPRVVHGGADGGQQHGQEGDRDGDSGQGDGKRRQAHAAQERDGERDQRQQADGHGGAGEDDGPAGRAHGGRHRGLVVQSGGAVLPQAGDDEQRVVDGHAEPDQRDQVLHDEVHRGDLGEGIDEQEGRRDGHGGHQQREQGDEAGEDDGQHRQGAEPAEQGLGQGAGPLAAAGVGLELAQAADAGLPARRGRRRHDPADGSGGVSGL